MQKPGDFKITKIERLIIRPGFPGRCHGVTFKCPDHNGPVDCTFQVWVPVAYPEAEVEHVARTVLLQRLLELGERAKASALADAAMGALRKRHSGDRSVRTDKLARQSSLQRTSRHLERGHIPLARYTLDTGHDPVPSDDLVMWTAWMKTSERWVEDTLLSLAANIQVRVCTVFLGIDVGFGGVGGPVLFETMVLGGIWDRDLYRYCTRQEAQEGHAAIVSQLVAHDKRIMQTPALIRARNLAHTTVQLAGRADMKAFVEQRANALNPEHPILQ